MSPGRAPLTNTGPVTGIDPREIECRHRGYLGVLVQLATGGVAYLTLDVRARLDLEHRLDRVVPAEVPRLLADVVQRDASHSDTAFPVDRPSKV